LLVENELYDTASIPEINKNDTTMLPLDLNPSIQLQDFPKPLWVYIDAKMIFQILLLIIRLLFH